MSRAVLPIPDVTPISLTTFDARDPETNYPPFPFGEESLDVGHEAGSPVTYDYPHNGGSHVSGKVSWVEFDARDAANDNDHLITAEERLRVAMAKQ